MCFGLVLFTQSPVPVSDDNQDNNAAQSNALVNSISAETNLNNNVELSNNEAVAGETITATVADPKYGYNISEVEFIDNQGEAVKNVEDQITGDVIKFIMLDKPVKIAVSYTTMATSEYNTPKNYEGKMT